MAKKDTEKPLSPYLRKKMEANGGVLPPRKELSPERKQQLADQIKGKGFKSASNRSEVDKISLEDGESGRISNLTPLEKWACMAYFFDSDKRMLYAATHGITDPNQVPSSTGITYANTKRIKDYVNSLRKMFENKSKTLPPMLQNFIGKLSDGYDMNDVIANNDTGAEGITKEQMIQLLEKTVRKNPSDYTAIKQLADLQAWKQKEEKTEDELPFLYCLPHKCKDCARKESPVCGYCSIQKESEGRLTEEEQAWVDENDKTEEP